MLLIDIAPALEPSSRTAQAARWLGLCTVILWWALALVFVEERTTFVDVAFHLFQQSTTGEVAIQNNRFVSGATQWLPTWLLVQGTGMATVQLAYSCVFAALYSLTWLVLEFGLRARALALGWALTWLSFATHTHYWIQSELPQGLALFTLALGLLKWLRSQEVAPLNSSRGGGVSAAIFLRANVQQSITRAAIPLLIFTAAFAHPLLIVPATFSYGFFALTSRETIMGKSRGRSALASAALVYYGAYLIRSTFFATAYDGAAGGAFLPAVEALISGELPYSFSQLAQNLLTTYWAFLLAFGLGLTLLWRAGYRWAATWTAAAICGHLLLVALSYPSDQVVDFYIENLYLPAGWMAAVALAYGWGASREFAAPRWVAIALLALAVLRVSQIAYVGRSIYTARLNELHAELELYRGKNVLLQETPELRERLIMTWGTPYEAWVLARRTNTPMVGYAVVPDVEPYRWVTNEPDRLIFTFTQPRVSELPPGLVVRESEEAYEIP